MYLCSVKVFIPCLSSVYQSLQHVWGYTEGFHPPICVPEVALTLSLSPWSYIIFALPSVRLILWCSLSFTLNLYAANPPSPPTQAQDISTVFVTTPCWPPLWFPTSCQECWCQLAKLGTEWWSQHGSAKKFLEWPLETCYITGLVFSWILHSW